MSCGVSQHTLDRKRIGSTRDAPREIPRLQENDANRDTPSRARAQVARTHDQLQHAVHEYKRDCAERPLMSMRLSRERFCLHPNIATASGTARGRRALLRTIRNMRGSLFENSATCIAHLGFDLAMCSIDQVHFAWLFQNARRSSESGTRERPRSSRTCLKSRLAYLFWRGGEKPQKKTKKKCTGRRKKRRGGQAPNKAEACEGQRPTDRFGHFQFTSVRMVSKVAFGL